MAPAGLLWVIDRCPCLLRRVGKGLGSVAAAGGGFTETDLSSSEVLHAGGGACLALPTCCWTCEAFGRCVARLLAAASRSGFDSGGLHISDSDMLRRGLAGSGVPSSSTSAVSSAQDGVRVWFQPVGFGESIRTCTGPGDCIGDPGRNPSSSSVSAGEAWGSTCPKPVCCLSRTARTAWPAPPAARARR